MRSLSLWAPLAILAAWLALTPEARAYLGHGRAETVYVSPVETVLSVPTTYVSPTVYTTSYYVPTSYYLSPTAYVIPTYRTTSLLRPRWVVERPIVTTTRVYDYDLTPTTYYYTPTVLDLPVASSYEAPCEETAGAPAAISSSVTRAPKAQAPAASSAPRQAPRPVVSVPKEEPPLQSEARPVPEPESETPPPPAEAAPAKPEDTLTTPPVPADLPDVPFPEIPPAEGEAPTAGTPPRETFKPAPPSGGILEGKVVSGTTGQAEKGIKVIVSHRRLPLAFVDREVTTDALGRYAIDVPPGDWSVKVVRPNGKTFSVQNITVSAGRIIADDGRAVPSLVINL